MFKNKYYTFFEVVSLILYYLKVIIIFKSQSVRYISRNYQSFLINQMLRSFLKE